MDGTKLEVRVQPRSSRDEIVAVAEGPLKVYVTAPPEGGKANQTVISLVARHLGIAKSTVSVVRGLRSRNKVLLVEGLSPQALDARLRSGQDVGDNRSDDVK